MHHKSHGRFLFQTLAGLIVLSGMSVGSVHADEATQNTNSVTEVAMIPSFDAAAAPLIAENSEHAEEPARKRFSGNVSWYGVPFNGRKTASGKTFDMNKLTCAHRTLPFGTKILIQNPRTGNSCTVEVIDRGPYVYSRILDLSRGAAQQLGILPGGLAFVNCQVIAK